MMKGLLVLPLVALFLFGILTDLTQAREEEKKITDILDSIFAKENYDKRIRPSYGGKPVKVSVSAYILDVYNIDEKNHEFTVQLYLRQRWVDDRLLYQPPAAGISYINLDPEHAKKIWIPDTFIVNERKSIKHDMTVANEMTRVSPNGEVHRSIRTTITASCSMNLKWFPFDRHLCGLDLESYAYNTGQYFYEWEVDDKQNPKLGISELATGTINQEVRGVQGKSVSIALSAGNYSRIGIEFLIVRTPTRYLQDVYFPAIALPIIGFITMSVGALHTRVLHSIICMVGQILFTSMLAMEMPKVSYQTALDFYVFNSTVMILNVVIVNFIMYHLLKPATNVKTRMRMRQLNGNAEDGKEILHEAEPSEDFNMGRPNFTSRYQEIAFGLCEKSKYTMPIFFGIFNVIYWAVVLIASSFYGVDFILLENRS